MVPRETLKFGIIPVNVGVSSAAQIIATAQAAEAAGFESLWTFEHVLLPTEFRSKYPYNESGDLGMPAEAPFFDPLITLAAIAMQTSTIRLGTGVNIVAQTNPLLLAKQAATLDVLSGGRFILGAGIGWLKQEFEALGVPFERRGARFDDYMVAIKKVWSGDAVEHESDFLSWHGFKSYPLPTQKPGVPIVIGGKAGRIYQRVARYGDGWFVPPCGADELATMLGELRRVCDDEGRDFEAIEITVLWDPEGGEGSLDALTRAGVSRVISMPGGLDGIKMISDRYIARTRQ